MQQVKDKKELSREVQKRYQIQCGEPGRCVAGGGGRGMGGLGEERVTQSARVVERAECKSCGTS